MSGAGQRAHGLASACDDGAVFGLYDLNSPQLSSHSECWLCAVKRRPPARTFDILANVHIEARLAELGLVLPEQVQPPAGIRLPFASVRLHDGRALIAGHGPLNPDGSLAGPFGKVPTDVTPEQAYVSARLVCLAMLGSLKRALGDLDRVTAWLRVFGMVNSAPDFAAQPNVINGCSDLLLELFGDQIGQHSRSAVGLAALPFNIPVEIEAEVAFE